METIKELQTRTEMVQAYRVMNELRSDLSEEAYQFLQQISYLHL